MQHITLTSTVPPYGAPGATTEPSPRVIGAACGQTQSAANGPVLHDSREHRRAEDLEIAMMNDVPCPCCGDPMNGYLMVCWECFRLTDKLSVGTHPDKRGGSFTVTRDDISRYEWEREDRVAAIDDAKPLYDSRCSLCWAGVEHSFDAHREQLGVPVTEVLP